jgi:hypothetical protein
LAARRWEDGRVTELTSRLRADLDRAGYYPELVADVLDVALAGEPVVSYLVHPETTFDQSEVRRHVTALVLTSTRLVVAHADDHPGESADQAPAASVVAEAVPLREIRSVVLTHGVHHPARHRAGRTPSELTLALGWGAVQRIDLEPAGCDDPNCESDHGLTGTLSADDIVVRISAVAEGRAAVDAAIAFSRALSAATARG